MHRADALRLRIGGVPYGVGAPLLGGLDDDPSVHLVREEPTILVRRLRAGELDAALVSSIEAFRIRGYRVVPGLGISSRGPARSVRAFRRPGRPIRRVGVDAGSETSVALLRVLLERRMGTGGYEMERVRPTMAPAELEHDLVLLIGDCGLRADPGGREVWDLGELWHRWTGLPFVYALWLIAPGAPAGRLTERLTAARRSSLAMDDGTAGAIYYEMGADEARGLRRFAREAAALGLSDPAIEPDLGAPREGAQSPRET